MGPQPPVSGMVSSMVASTNSASSAHRNRREPHLGLSDEGYDSIAAGICQRPRSLRHAYLHAPRCRLYLCPSMSQRESPAAPPHRRKLALALFAVLALCAGAGFAVLAYPVFYRERIYPGVTVQGMRLGGMTTEEAAARLARTLSDSEERTLTLQGPQRSWQIRWADVGQHYDRAQTADAAYRVGRREPWTRRSVSAWRIRFQGAVIKPYVTPADPGRVKAYLEDIAPQVHVAPRNAELDIASAGVTCIQGEAGRALDVEATTKRMIDALANSAPQAEMVTDTLRPQVLETEPACAQAQSLLSEAFTLIADDPLTDYRANFTASAKRMTSWLQAVPADGGLALRVREGPIEAWLLELAPQLEPERILQTEDTLRRTLRALKASEHQARCAIRHPETTYVVQPGDTLFDIAYSLGVPQWRLEEANPDVEPSQLLVGRELTIPSIDVLFPEPLVPGKRIEIDLPQQQLRAYEDGHLVYDFTCSSGMTSTPTIAGQFQILFKEPEAYAQRWALEMPYFMAIYYEGPDFANGIHELPIRADGQRLWASVLGWPASYGCIILDVDDAGKLYEWAPVGTLVRIEGVAPGTPAHVPTYDDQAPEG